MTKKIYCKNCKKNKEEEDGFCSGCGYCYKLDIIITPFVVSDKKTESDQGKGSETSTKKV